MNAPRLTLHQAVDDCEIRILAAAERSRAELREAATYANGIAHGYFMSGAADVCEYRMASDRLREISLQGERRFEALAEIAEGGTHVAASSST